jgi:hypothetical protein
VNIRSTVRSLSTKYMQGRGMPRRYRIRVRWFASCCRIVAGIEVLLPGCCQIWEVVAGVLPKRVFFCREDVAGWGVLLPDKAIPEK